MTRDTLVIRCTNDGGGEFAFRREICLKSVFLREALENPAGDAAEVAFRPAEMHLIHFWCHEAVVEWDRLPALAQGPLAIFLPEPELACVADAENPSELARAAHWLGLERLEDIALYAAAWREVYGGDWPPALLERFHELILHPHVSAMLPEKERQWGPAFWPAVFEKLAPTTPHLEVAAECGIERYQRAAHCMSRWRVGEITWREIPVPAPTVAESPSWFPLGHDRLLLHPSNFSCAVPNVLTNADAFWIVQVGRQSHECHALPLPDLPPDDQLLFALFVPETREMVVVRNAPDGESLPDDVETGDFPRRHLFRDCEWHGLVDKGPGRQPLLRYRLVVAPEVEAGFIWRRTGEEERIWFDPRHEEDDGDRSLMSRGTINERFSTNRWGEDQHLGLSCKIEPIGPEENQVGEFRYTLRETGNPARIHGSLVARHHVNHNLQAMDVDLALVSGAPDAGDYVSEDAFLENMRLYDWKTGKLIRTIPLDFKERFIEVEWDRGILPGRNQCFVTACTRYHYPDFHRISLTNVITVLVATPEPASNGRRMPPVPEPREHSNGSPTPR